MASEMYVPFLGPILADGKMVAAGDMGNLEALSSQDSLKINIAYGNVLKAVLAG